MGADEGRPRMLCDNPHELGEQFVLRRERRAAAAPLRMAAKLLPTFVEAVDRFEKCRGIGRMDEDRQTQPTARLPNRVPTRIVDGDQRTVGVAIDEAEVLEDFQSRGAALFGVLE